MRPRAPLLRLLLAVSAAAAAVVGEPGTALPPTTGGATLAIVFDVTGSMWDDLMQVMDGASRILEHSLSRGSRVIANYALVPFHDPDIGPVTLTSDPAVFQRELRELYVQGGGDCPEMSLGAIKAAVEVANPGSFIYVFSDARAKDYHKKDEVLRLLQLKQPQVVFVLTGDCGDRTHPGYLAYEEIAATSSGQVFHLDKQQVTEVLKWVESALQASKVHLLSTDHEEGGEHTWKIPFDPSLKEVTISLSGPGPEIEVRDPLGRILQRDDGLNVLLSIPDSAKVVAFKPEHSGLWSIKIYSSGRHSVRITGISNIDFRAGFSTQPSLDLNHTIEWPLQGVPISLVINSTGLRVPGRLDSVELSHSSGQSLLTLPTQPLSNGSTHQLWGGPPFHSPQERFYLKVKGKDHEGNPLLRVSGVSYRGVIPAQGRGSQRLPVCGGEPWLPRAQLRTWLDGPTPLSPGTWQGARNMMSPPPSHPQRCARRRSGPLSHPRSISGVDEGEGSARVPHKPAITQRGTDGPRLTLRVCSQTFALK